MLKRIFAVCGLSIALGGCASGLFGTSMPPASNLQGDESGLPRCGQGWAITSGGMACRMGDIGESFPILKPQGPR